MTSQARQPRRADSGPASGECGLRRATDEERPAVALTVAEAYGPLSLSRWLVPDPRQRPAVLYADAMVMVDMALAIGQVWTVPDRAAVAVWLPHEPGSAPSRAGWFIHACGPYADRFRLLNAEIDEHRPGSGYQHLVFLAVDPMRQGAGLGLALLRHGLWQLDHDQVPAFAVAPTVVARSLLVRHGFRDRGQRIDLPGRLQVWPMWRPPGLPQPASTRPE